MPFRDIIGHHRLVALLARAAAGASLPPSLIFAGPEGVGKRLAALAVAQSLNCLRPLKPDGREAPPRGGRGQRIAVEGWRATVLEIDACGSCLACRRIERGIHADVLVIEPGDTGSIKIEQVREATDRAAYRPFEGRRRAVIIDEAELMISDAQSALLKTLEEPPSASIFILVASRPDSLLPTVRSRCLRLRFGRLDADEIARTLMAAHGYTEADAHATAAVADGSLGQALRFGSGELRGAREAAQRVLQDVALASDPRRLQSAKGLYPKEGPRRTSAEQRETVALRLRALASLVRDLMVLTTRADDRWLANRDLKSSLDQLGKSYGGDRIMRAFSAVDRALDALERNASPKIVADWLVFQL